MIMGILVYTYDKSRAQAVFMYSIQKTEFLKVATCTAVKILE